MSHRNPTAMKIFQTVRESFVLIYFSEDRRWFDIQMLANIVECILVLALQCIYLFHVADTPDELMHSIFYFTVGILVFISFMSTVQQIMDIFILMNKVEKVINKRLKHPSSKAMYEKTFNMVEKYSKIIYFLIIDVSVPGFILPKAILSYFIYYTTDAGSEAFQLSIPTWLPFNWKNPFGYLISIYLQYIIILLPIQYIGCFTLFAFTSFLIGMCFAKDMKNDLRSIDKIIKENPRRTTIYKRITRMVHFTNEKRMLKDFSQILEITLMVVFLGCTGAISLALLMIQIELIHKNSQIDSVMLFESVFCGFWAIILVFTTCECGQRFSDAFNNLNNELGQINWYRLPIRAQRILPVILINAQQPMVVKCYGNIPCGRETFKKVVNTAYKYFMILRKFYK